MTHSIAYVSPDRHWPGAVQELLMLMRPREVWVPGEDRLSELVREATGSAASAAPHTGTDLVVISDVASARSISAWLDAAMADGVGGQAGPPVIVVAPAAAAARPDARADVERAAAREGWAARFVEGFGGLAVLAPCARLDVDSPLRDAWDSIGGGEHGQALARNLDQELARSLARLDLLEQEMAALLDELTAGLAEEESAAEAISTSLGVAATRLAAAAQRERRLEHRAITAEALAAAARGELAQERAWIAAQARAVAQSQSWRVGHRLVRALRLLTFRRDRGTDAVQGIIVRVEARLAPPERSGGDGR